MSSMLFMNISPKKKMMSGDCESCGEHCLECTCKPLCRRQQNGLEYIEDDYQCPDPIRTLKGTIKINNNDAVQLQKCECFHCLDGYETYKIDENTIGVRPFWISVKDRLPSENIRVIVLCKDNHIEIEKITYPKDHNLWSCISKEEITHWMPLPQPPNE